MQQVLTDLWQTRTDSPFPGLTTHAFLWTGPNALFYSTATDGDFDELDELGGIADQYLSHRDEAGPMLAKIADHFDSAAERNIDVNGVEVIPTPGHSPGSTCYVADGAEGRYLFTGDTLVLGDSGEWWAGYIPGIGDADALAASLRLLRTLSPDVVISSAFQGDSAVHRIEPARWTDHVDQALAGLSTATAKGQTRYV